MKTLRPRPGVVESHLDRIPAFSGLSPDDHAILADRALLRLYAPGDRLFEQGHAADDLFCVASGAVRVVVLQPGGREKVVHLMTGPGLVAEVPVMMQEPFPATAICNEECTVVVVPRRALVELVRKDCELALRLLASSMTRLRQLTGLLADHGERSAAVRVASFLLGAAGQADQVNLHAAKKDVASYLGLQPESLSRALGALRKIGAIEVADQDIRILDRSALEKTLAEG